MSTEITYKMKAFELAGVALKGAAWVHDYDQGMTGEEGKKLFAKHKNTISEQEIEAIVVKTQQSCSAAGVPQAIMDKIVASIRSSASAPSATRETLQKQAEAEVAFAVAEVAKEKAEEAAEMSVAQRGAMLSQRAKVFGEVAKLDKEIDALDQKLMRHLNPEEQKQWKELTAARLKAEAELKKAKEEHDAAMVAAKTDEERRAAQEKYKLAQAEFEKKMEENAKLKKPLDDKMQDEVKDHGTAEDKKVQKEKEEKQQAKAKKLALAKKNWKLDSDHAPELEEVSSMKQGLSETQVVHSGASTHNVETKHVDKAKKPDAHIAEAKDADKAKRTASQPEEVKPESLGELPSLAAIRNFKPAKGIS